jgi:hypothetical protein
MGNGVVDSSEVPLAFFSRHQRLFRFVDTPPFRPVFLHGCSFCNACSIYLYCDPEPAVPKNDRDVVNCPLECWFDPVRGGRIRLLC